MKITNISEKPVIECDGYLLENKGHVEWLCRLLRHNADFLWPEQEKNDALEAKRRYGQDEKGQHTGQTETVERDRERGAEKERG